MHSNGSRFGLRFVLSNHAPQPKTIHYFRPFMQFALRAIADSHELTIVRGEFDGPVTPATLQLPAGGTATLETPITLQFAATAPPQVDAMAWTIIGTQRTVELRATLQIDSEVVPECGAHLDLP